MPDLDIIGENSGSLSLTAADIRSMTDWPDQLIIDYLNLVEMMNRITQAINNDFGTMALQNADAVAITGGTISGVTLDDIFIGDVTATNITTVNLTATGTVNLHDVTITGYTHTSGLTDDATSVQVTITDSLVNIGQDTDLGSTVSVTYVTLDGTNDYMLRGAALTGATATKNLTIVTRIRIAALASNNRAIFYGSDGGAVVCQFLISNVTNLLTVSIDNVAGSNVAAFIVSSVGYTSADGWLNICISADCLNDTEGQCRVNGVDVYDAATSDLDNEALGYAACTNWAVGSQIVGAAAKFNGDMAFLYVNFDAAIDFDVEANERLFFDASGIPVYLGANGELPTGTAPIMYFNGAASSFPTNKGTGGGMTLTGSIAGATEEFGVLHITDGGYYTDSALLGDMGAETFNSLGYYENGVYVPTISSTSIFTNKTIDIDLNTITVAGGANGQTLIYNATTGKFDNATLTEGVGIDVLNAAGAITLSLDIVGLTTDTIAAGDFIAFADITETNIPNKTTWANAALTITAVGTLTVLQVDNININGNTISSTAGTDLLITPLAGQQLILDGTIEIDAGVVTGATSITSTQFLGALNGSVGAITPAAGTFTVVVVDNITIDLNTISSTSGALNITPVAGSAIVLDATISVDAGVVTGVTSLTINSANGIDYSPGSDIDTDIETVNVTGTPLRKWKETEDRWAQNKGITITAGGLLIGLPETGVLSAFGILQVHGVSSSTAAMGFARWSANTGGPVFDFAKSRGAAIGTFAAVQENDDLGTMQWLGDDGTTISSAGNIAAEILGEVAGPVSTGVVPGRLLIETTDLAGARVPRYNLSYDKFNVIVPVRIGASNAGSVITSTPAGLLDLVANNSALTSTISNNTLRFWDADTSVANNQPIGIIEWYNADATVAAGIRSYILSASKGASGGGDLRFGVSADGGAAAELARLTSVGLRVGSGVDPTVALDVTGAALISTTLGVTGVLTLTPAISMLSTGGAPTVGELTLVIGTKTVNTTAATATCKIFFQRKTAGGTIGFATTYTINAGVSFTVSSDSALDTSTYAWWIVEAR